MKMCIAIGYGVFTTQGISCGQFVLEYVGDIIPVETADAIEDQTYIYYFTVAGLQYRWDWLV